ncbi:MAG: iron ABC transporter permease [Hydrogenibacillus schlegelii]|nr:iron ABC transporter permease [Hydrogenibacillus schlegelii]
MIFRFVPSSAFGFGLLSVALTWLISRFVRADPVLVLVLSGIIVGSLFSAALSLLKLLADPLVQLPEITYWLMGGFATARLKDALLAVPLISGGFLLLYLFRWRLNLLALGEEEAQALGLNTTAARGLVVFSATLMTATAVALTGIIGWVGLVVPHMARFLTGAHFARLLPLSFCLGGAFMLLIDTLARTATTIEIPVSILMNFIGAPIFFYLLNRTRRDPDGA